MKLAIVGSRTFDNYELLCDTLDKFLMDNHGNIDLVISGGAKGADTLGEQWAKSHAIPTKIIKADWNKHGKSAGYIRNVDIIKECDYVIVFWDGKSKGTKHDIDLANRYNKPILIKNF